MFRRTVPRILKSSLWVSWGLLVWGAASGAEVESPARDIVSAVETNLVVVTPNTITEQQLGDAPPHSGSEKQLYKRSGPVSVCRSYAEL